MRHWILGLAVAVVGASAAAADEKAEAVVKKAIEAHGGADALNKFLGLKATIKGELVLMGADIPFTGKSVSMAPDRHRLDMEAEIMGNKLVVRQVIKGDAATNKVTFGGMAVPAPDAKDELLFQAALQEAERYTPLLDGKKFEIAAAPDEEVDGAKASVVTVKVKALNKEAKFYFDQKTGLHVKTASKGKAANDSGELVEMLKESVNSEFKKVNGIQTATKTVLNHDGKKFMTATMSDVERVEKIDDKEFTTDD